MKDPYRLLNLRRNAHPDAIKQAYRKLAKALHPDRNPGDRQAEQRFKDITQAYNLLSDPESRQDFDRGRIDASGQKRRQPFGGSPNGASPHPSGDASWWSQGGETIFDRMFGRFGRAGEAAGSTADQRGRSESSHDDGTAEPPPPGASSSEAEGETTTGADSRQGRAGDQHHRLEIDFLTAALGGKRRLTPSGGRTLDVDIRPGTEDNAVLRLRGQGRPARQGSARGDLLVHLRVLGHTLFSREGQDVHLDLPVSLKEALLGARVRTPTIDGPVWLTIPPNANSGQTLRLKGKGVADRGGQRGDQYVRLMVMLPKAPSAAMAADLGRLADHEDYDVRTDLDGH